jgi:hypothetical protein
MQYAPGLGFACMSDPLRPYAQAAGEERSARENVVADILPEAHVYLGQSP